MEHRKLRRAFSTPYHAHALTFSVYRRQPHLLLPGAAAAFLQALDVPRQDLSFEVWAYVVMPEHVHVVLHPCEEVYAMAKIVATLKRRSAHAIFELHPHLREESRVQRCGRVDEFRFWQAGGGYDRNIYSARAAWAELRYVHNNPPKRELCESFLDWKWSSAGAYGDPPRPTPISVDLCDWFLDG